MSESKPRCVKCGSIQLAIERRMDGDAHCNSCGHDQKYSDCFLSLDQALQKIQELESQIKTMNENCISLSLHESRMKANEDYIAQLKSVLSVQLDMVATNERLTKQLEVVREALKMAEYALSLVAHTSFPINVREPDGSISQHRPKTTWGVAYDKIKEALAKLDAIERGEV